jgi:hypothetical protein
MGVVVDSSSTRQGSKEMGKEFGFRVEWEWKDWENGSRWGRGGDDSNRGFSNGWWEVFYEDVSKQDMLDNFFELDIYVDILVFGGQGVLKLRAYNVSLLCSDVGKNVEEVRQGGNR